MNENLHQRLAALAGTWRAEGYPSDEYPAIAETLEWSRDPETEALRYLRPPQFRALETYWYLRLIQGTPRIPALYRALFPADEDMDALLAALGVPQMAFSASNYQLDRMLRRIAEEDGFVRTHKLEAPSQRKWVLSVQYVLPKLC